MNKQIQYIKHNLITEYDLKSGGLNILTDLGYLSKEQHDNFLAMDKIDRNVKLGKMLQKDQEMNEALMKGFADARRYFFQANLIEPADILTIKKDAIFLINKNDRMNLQIAEYSHYVKKNVYRSFININGREHYLAADSNELTVKKYPELAKTGHQDYLFKFLKEILVLDEDDNKDKIYQKIAILKYKLVDRLLPKEYYRSIHSGYYDIELANKFIQLETIDDSLVPYINISYNLDFIIELIQQLL